MFSESSTTCLRARAIPNAYGRLLERLLRDEVKSSMCSNHIQAQLASEV